MEEAGEYDITIEQGSGFSLPLTYEAPEGSLVDFTGSTARLHARLKFSSADTLFELTTENVGIELRTVLRKLAALGVKYSATSEIAHDAVTSYYTRLVEKGARRVLDVGCGRGEDAMIAETLGARGNRHRVI